MKKSPAPINLLAKKRSNSDVILEWALTTGRFIIIVTETIALAAFAYRFVLDKQIIDLHDSIKRKQAILTFYKKDEETYRLLQNKFSTLSTLNGQVAYVPTLTSEFVELAKGKAILQTLDVTMNSVKIIAETPSIPLMNSLLASIRQHPRVAGIDVTSVENDPTTGIITLGITISINTKKGTHAG